MILCGGDGSVDIRTRESHSRDTSILELLQSPKAHPHALSKARSGVWVRCLEGVLNWALIDVQGVKGGGSQQAEAYARVPAALLHEGHHQQHQALLWREAAIPDA